MSTLFSGPQPRLIPSMKSDEDRATSSFLAVFLAVTPFRKALMKSLGRSARKSGNDIKAQLHPSFRGKYSDTDIPDGLIAHEKGGKTWRAAIEVKVKASDLELPQLERYLARCVEQKFDALITISNEMCVSPDRPPLRLKSSDRKLKRLPHFHWSWSFIKFEADSLLMAGDFDSQAERFILAEFVRFLEDAATGVQGFKQMNATWKNLVEDLKARAHDIPQEYLENAVSDWHQECADLAFQLSACLGREVSLVLTGKSDREARLDRDVGHLKKTGDLIAAFDVGDGKHRLNVTMEVDQRSLKISKSFDPPKTAKMPITQLEHFIKRVAGPDEEGSDGQHEGTRIAAKWPYVSDMTSTTLFDAMQDVHSGELKINRLNNPDKDSLQYIELQYFPTNVAKRVGSRKGVIELVEQSVAHFCEHYIDI